MTQQLEVGIDLDNTIADWEKAYVRDALMIDPEFPVDEFRQRGGYGLDTASSSVFTRIAAMTRPGFYAEMDIIDGAREALELILRSGHNLTLISQPDVDNPTGHSDKLWWVKNKLPAHYAARLVLTHDKTMWMGDILIDDKPQVTGRRTPTWKQVYYSQRYNQHLPGPRIDSWLDLDALWQLGLIEAQEEVAA